MHLGILQAEALEPLDIRLRHFRERIDFLKQDQIRLDHGQLAKLEIEPSLARFFRFARFDGQSAWLKPVQRVVGQHGEPLHWLAAWSGYRTSGIGAACNEETQQRDSRKNMCARVVTFKSPSYKLFLQHCLAPATRLNTVVLEGR